MPTNEKICSKCDIKKPATTDYFYFRSDTGSLRAECIVCKTAGINREARRVKDREYYSKHTERYREQFREYYKRTYQQRRPHTQAYARKYYQVNKVAVLAKCSIYKKSNRARLLYNTRYKSDALFRLRSIVSGSIRSAIKHNGGRKGGSILNLLPFTISELKVHLESLWEPWMSWDNYGKHDYAHKTWHIDHIIPISRLPFNSMTHPNFKKVWALSNLRPLEASKNMSKGASI